MNAPLVSVLIPVYNGAPFLAESLDSVLAQSFQDFEIIISDDCSTDGSGEIIERYAAADNRIRRWRNPQNLGMIANFNLCIDQARGEFIKFALQDDKLLDSSALQQMVEALRKNPSVSLVASASFLIDALSRKIELRNRFGPSRVWKGKGALMRCLEQNGNAIGEPSLTLFRKQQAARGFDRRFSQILDFEMWFHLLEQGDFAFIDEPLCAFRRHKGQQTETNKRNKTGGDEQVILMETYYAKPWLREAATKKMLFSQIYFLRKYYGRRADHLVAEMMKKLGRAEYARRWLGHKISRPFKKLRKQLVRIS